MAFKIVLYVLIFSLQVLLARAFFRISLMRGMFNSNSVTLTCSVQLNGGPFPSDRTAVFYRNNTQVSAASAGQPVYQFVVSFDNEGTYSCGLVGNISETINILPDPSFRYGATIDLSKKTFYAQVGEVFIISPYIGPGVWHSRYYIDWTLGDNTVGQIQGPRTIAPVIENGYTVNPETFELTIGNVLRSNEGDYHGRLGSVEVTNGIIRGFTDTTNLNISLVVYEVPVIVSPPEQAIITPGQAAVFSCGATGYPRPTIEWSHDGTTVSTPVGDDGVTSTLSITNVEASGSVQCIAMVTILTEPNTDDIIRTHNLSADLTVLWIRNVVVTRTLESIFFVVKLVTPIEGDILLNVQSNAVGLIPSCREGNTAIFISTAFPGMIPDITIQHRGMRSDPYRPQNPADECAQMFLNIVIPCVVAVTCLVVVLVFIFLTVCTVKIFEYKVQKHMFKNSNDKVQTRIFGATVGYMGYNRNDCTVHISPSHNKVLENGHQNGEMHVISSLQNEGTSPSPHGPPLPQQQTSDANIPVSNRRAENDNGGHVRSKGGPRKRKWKDLDYAEALRVTNDVLDKNGK